MLLYALLYLTGYEQATLEQVKSFRQWGSRMAGHPEYGHLEGVETTTGPLGQGISTAVGMAIAEKSMAARFGRKVVDHKIWVIVGDGCLMEGISQEAIGLAGKQELDNLIVLWDNNNITIDGRVTVSDITDQHKRFEASGWQVLSCDGHDPADIDRALTEAKKAKRPVLVDCKTIIGFGAPTKSDSYSVHGSPLGDKELAATKEIYGWPYGPFEIPAEIKAEWEAIGSKGATARAEWEERLNALSPAKKAEFERQMSRGVSKKLASAIRAFKKAQSEAAP